MAEYSANALQNVLSNQPVVFTESPVPCTRGLIFHRDESGIFRLANTVDYCGWNNCGCGCCPMPESIYQVTFSANIAIPEGGTVEAISLALAIDGEVDPSSTMTVTPAAAEDFWNVSTAVLVAIPAICRCSSVSIRNISTQAVDVQNANIIFSYLGVRR